MFSVCLCLAFTAFTAYFMLLSIFHSFTFSLLFLLSRCLGFNQAYLNFCVEYLANCPHVSCPLPLARHHHPLRRNAATSARSRRRPASLPRYCARLHFQPPTRLAPCRSPSSTVSSRLYSTRKCRALCARPTVSAPGLCFRRHATPVVSTTNCVSAALRISSMHALRKASMY